MNFRRQLIYEFIIVFLISLLTFGLFDTNSLVMVLVYAMVVSAVSWVLRRYLMNINHNGGLALINSFIASGVAWLMAWISTNFRVTFSTWVLFLLLVYAGYRYVSKFTKHIN